MKKIIITILIASISAGLFAKKLPKEIDGVSTEGFSKDQIEAYLFLKENLATYDAIVGAGFSLNSIKDIPLNKRNKNEYYTNCGKILSICQEYYRKNPLPKRPDEFDWSNDPKYVKFEDKYGTKEELLKQGYVVNETMFYYPANGEKDWRVGNFVNEQQVYRDGSMLKFDYTKDKTTFWYIVVFYDKPFTNKEYLERAKKAKYMVLDLGTISLCDNFHYDYKKMNNFFKEMNDAAKDEKKTVIFFSCYFPNCREWRLLPYFYARYHIVDDTVPYDEIEYEPNENLDVILVGTNTPGDNIVGCKYNNVYNENKTTRFVEYEIPDTIFRELIFDPLYKDQNYGYWPDCWTATIEDTRKTVNFILSKLENVDDYFEMKLKELGPCRF